ncbi:MAG: inorganic phosphate transporter [Bacteroidaceae bacterium]|nr:inorganic phosphate transporter [Bacteroidaceae bacterium]
MELFFYIGILVFLFTLATFDLSIGVANDAVNFMSPAVGAKVAKFKTAIIVAAVGIFVGATTSSGMMDIARHGIMQPQHYYLNEVMCIFLAVSATDVILMDIFNTLGLPTSTTVSMVFGLFGATTALALTKIIGEGAAYGDLINTDKALTVIISIFLSVAIAFVFGLIVMWISRVVFTFNYEKKLKYGIAVFGGLSITSIFYFLLVSGLKNSKLLISINPEWTPAYMDEHKLYILLTCFVVFTILVEILHLLKVNIFKLIVLFGTFALAMAFAGNDLVNFIGVPLAGLESVLVWFDSGCPDASTYAMDTLAVPSTQPFFVNAKPWFLIGAGIIMTIAVMTSKKARKVIENTNNLSRQDDGEEIFSSSKLARKTVRGVLTATSFVSSYVPKKTTNWINSRFNTEEAILEEGMAFDLVRASVNLVLAGLLIVVGTSLQLPLSTTYVAFMVAMGSSLADRAWGRETAVYRITGVITVVGGWFITAGAAFLMSMTIASINYFGGFIAMICIVGVIAFVLINNNRKFKQKQQESENVDTLFRQLVRCTDKAQSWTLLRQHVTNTQNEILTTAHNMIPLIVDGLVKDDIKRLREAQHQLEETRSLWKRYRRKEILGMRKIDPLMAVEKNTWFHLGCNNISQMLYGLKRMLELIIEHVDNNFNPMPEQYAEELRPLAQDVLNYIRQVQGMIVSGDFTRFDEIVVDGNALKAQISTVRHKLQNHIQHEDANIKIALLYLNTLQELQEITSMLRHLIRAAKRFQE